MAPPESAYALWYYPGINRFSDEEGKILHDLSDLFSVWQLDEWKRTQEYDVLLDRKGDWCELYYASECEELDFLNHTKFLGVFREYDLLF
jgi:hypothetical protein